MSASSESSVASELGKDYVQQVLLKRGKWHPNELPTIDLCEGAVFQPGTTIDLARFPGLPYRPYYKPFLTLIRTPSPEPLVNKWLCRSPRFSSTVRCLARSDPIYKDVCSTIDQRLLHCAHSFHLESVEIIENCGCSRSFHSELSKCSPRPYFLFHGTKYSNHKSIFDNGFSLSAKHWGNTDEGYIGKGIYLSPLPEYSAAYIKDVPGVHYCVYDDPVDLGVTCQLLGCIALVGRTEQVHQKQLGREIASNLESHWAWVKSNGDITTAQSEYFAQEFVIKIPTSVYPRFRVSLKRVNKELIWFDSDIANGENSRYLDTLKLQSDISVYATGNSDKALDALKKKKNGTEYRLVTAGHGGEELVRKARSAGVHCHVLVFCRSVDYHKQWARKFSNVQVTGSKDEFMRFATWK